MAQITRVTSEALQATIRRLLPSQQGFGEDLEATNVITPIIDLTPSAEGSEVRADMQTALAFGSQTAFSVEASSSTLANSPGFWRITGISSLEQPGSRSPLENKLSLTDGSTTKDIFIYRMVSGSAGGATNTPFDFTIYLDVGESITVTAASNASLMAGSYRQIADTSGNLVNPSGFTPQ